MTRTKLVDDVFIVFYMFTSILLNLRTKQYLLTLCEAIKINKRWTTAQHRHNTNTSVTFRSLLSSLTKKEKEK